MGLSIGSGRWTAQDPAIDMAWQSMQTLPSQSVRPPMTGAFMQPLQASTLQGHTRNAFGMVSPMKEELAMNFRTNALPTQVGMSALAGSRVMDVRDVRRSSCVAANEYASLCGNVVVLRPSVATHASTSKGV